MGNEFLTQSVWWGTNALEGLLLVRAARGGFFWKYPVFYVYLSYVLFESLLRFYVSVFKPDLFQSVYWCSQFVSVTIGYGVIWEIFRQALAGYPGAGRVARTCLLTIFILVLCKVFLNALSGSVYSPAKTTADLERYLRVVQAALLMVIVVLLAYYLIPIGRNINGMILGYGFFLSMSVMQLTLRSYLGDAFQPVWQHLGWVSYSLALIIWCSTLWSYHPSPKPKTEVEIERDYELLTLHTARLLKQLRANLVRVIRP